MNVTALEAFAAVLLSLGTLLVLWTLWAADSPPEVPAVRSRAKARPLEHPVDYRRAA